MSGNRSSWKQKATAFLVSCFIVVVLLVAGELYCRWFTRINFLDNSGGLFAPNRFGTTYGNTPNYKGVSFGETFYTDENGFRIDPEFKSTAAEDAQAIMILGDSVSFGPAVRDDLTIASRLRRAVSTESVYNASVIGYDASDYKNVIFSLIPRQPRIKTVLFFCLNDLTDVSARDINNQVSGNGDISHSSDPSPIRKINDYLRSPSKLYFSLENALRDTQMIYFQNDLASYQKDDAYLQNGFRPLIEIKRQLETSGVSLKVFVLPYEAQLRKNAPPEFLLPQKRVDDFLKENNFDYFDLTQDFQQAGPDVRDLFLYGDPMHLSEEGHRLVANKVCGTLAGCRLE